ncbi:hypothetical protein [Nostoc sp. CHAB 5836]|nr:hypothetical protein [Nostoc sp. CHAB 5836]
MTNVNEVIGHWSLVIGHWSLVLSEVEVLVIFNWTKDKGQMTNDK